MSNKGESITIHLGNVTRERLEDQAKRLGWERSATARWLMKTALRQAESLTDAQMKDLGEEASQATEEDVEVSQDERGEGGDALDRQPQGGGGDDQQARSTDEGQAGTPDSPDHPKGQVKEEAVEIVSPDAGAKA